MFIYKIDIPNTPGMSYIGQTTKLLKHRWRQHNDPNSTTLIGRALQAFGPGIITPLFEVDTQEELDAYEIRTIKSMNTIYPHGYNLQEGGRGKRNRATGGGTSDSKEVYWDDEPEVEDDEDDIAEHLTGPPRSKRKNQPAKIRKIVGNIMFKYQAVKEQNEYIQHMDSSVMKGNLNTRYMPSKNQRKINARGDWATYMERLFGKRHKEDLNGKLYEVWFLSPQEYDKLVDTICTDFNGKHVALME